MTTRLVILDRDGVINEDSIAYVKTAEEWHAIPGSIESIASLSQAGIVVCVATNQAGIGRGIIQPDALTAMHRKMVSLVEQAGGKINEIQFCPHHPDDQCDCRKPLPGMLDRIISHQGINNKADIWMVGDSLRDLQAGEAAEVNVALVLTGNGEATRERLDELQHPDQVKIFDSLSDFARQFA